MLQAEAINVTKQGSLGFSFEVHGKSHKFEAANAGERDSWVVAIEKQVEESKAIKDEITSKDSYKDNVKEFCKFFTPMTSPPTCNDRPLMHR